MKIANVTIQNFRNFVKEHFDFDDRTDITRNNAWGKSNLADAIAWVLTGKLMDGSSDIESIKPKHNTKAVVMVEIQLDDGKGTKIAKSYKENWIKARGSETMELKGHTTTCYLNGLELNQSQYDSELETIFKTPKEYFPIMLDPLHFGTKLEWKKRREIVNKVVGEVTFEEITANNEVFAKNPEWTAELKRNLDLFTGKIDMAKKNLNQSLLKVRKEEKELESQIVGLNKIQPTITRAAYENAQIVITRTTAEINELKEASSSTDKQKRLEAELVTLRDRFKVIRESQYFGQEPKRHACPKCNYTLNEQEYNAELAKHAEQKKAFELTKQKQLQSLNEQGQAIKAEYEALKVKKCGTIEAYTEKIHTLQALIDQHREQVDSYNAYEYAQREAKKLEQTLNAVRAEIAKLETTIDLLNLYVSAMLVCLADKIKEAFGDIKFRLVEDNIKEGSWNEVCDVMDGEVPYERTNTAQQIKLGVKVIEAIRSKLGFEQLPVIIDNAEVIVDRTFETNSQTICLIAGKE